MADSIRLRAGNREGMPRLSDREPSYVRDEQALYVGTPEGNVKLCAADTEGRVAALEAVTAAQEATLSAHSGLLSVHRETLSAHSGMLSSHAERLTAHRETLDTHAELLESVEGVQQTHSEQLLLHQKEIQTHAEQLSGCQGTMETHHAAIERLETEKLSAVPAAALPVLAAEADTVALIAAYNGLLAALQACGVMNREEVT